MKWFDCYYSLVQTVFVQYLIFSFTAFLIISCGNAKNNQVATKKASSIEKEQRPNIIFYLSDDQDIYDYGCYGNKSSF